MGAGRGPTRIHHASHGIGDSNPVLRIDRNSSRRVITGDHLLQLRRKLIGSHNMRTIKCAGHGDAANRMCELNGSGGNCALANAYRDGFTGIPFLAEVFDLPLL